MNETIFDFLEKKKEIMVLIDSAENNSIRQKFCIVPNSWDQKQINFYVSNSLNISADFITIVFLEDVMVLSKSIINFKTKNDKIIDYYWYDVKEFVIEIKNKLQELSVVLVAGYDTDEGDVKEIIDNHFSDNYQINVDYYRDSWLSKEVSI
ncbi:MAG: hypothetical protein LKF42_07460 [Streptococcaceae bacterium]|nr:hypothetical protein [Streptococcaceae bacterium]MCH4177464.1 hypothetical protein [Streptococcaceae bacterium]